MPKIHIKLIESAHPNMPINKKNFKLMRSPSVPNTFSATAYENRNVESRIAKY